ncbi:zinc finger protein 208-like protein [Moniliophthora roreri MCA 2997]|uniref:Zinc finger protein 208-like protein n=1 Tax=Moniliophthora roreri (strain MCA 2997) TaxID=1381753 RepID=V2X2F5_MONRO|nr:zinc finger protein 208-like protein [Moniliophthora roreri MCA 2997]
MHRERVAKDRVIRAARERRKTEARFTCGLGCGQTFTARHNLTHHINSHLGVRRYTCRTCGKSFVTPCDCKRHERKISV